MLSQKERKDKHCPGPIQAFTSLYEYRKHPELQQSSTFGADVEMSHTVGPYWLRIHDAVYRKISTLEECSSVIPSFGRLHIMGTDGTNNHRSSHSANIAMKHDTLEVLHHVLKDCDTYTSGYINLYEK